MSHLAGVDRTQPSLFPETLDDYVAADHPVRVIDAFVASLDLEALGFARATPAVLGRPSYPPGALLRLYLYGYLNRVRSSRRLERETHRNVEVLWLLGQLRPDHKTIADFRRDHPEALRAVGRAFIAMCRELELFGSALVAIDGSKLRADNSRERNWTAAALARRQAELEAELTRYLADLDTQDGREVAEPGTTDPALPEKLARLRDRQAYYAALAAALAASGESQRSLTDPESRRMKVRGGTDVCYNAQIAVEGQHHLIVADDVTNAVTDVHQLAPMARTAQAALGGAPLDVVADRGYHHAGQVQQCVAAGLTPYVPQPATSKNARHGRFTKADFTYDASHDAYRCPAGQMLPYSCTETEPASAPGEPGRPIRYYAHRPACAACTQRPQCTTSAQGRRIARYPDEALVEAMAARVRAHPELARRRKSLVEHPFGTLKRGRDQSYVLLRGLRKVRGEFSLMALAYNLTRVITVLGVPTLLAALRGRPPAGTRATS